MYTILKCFLLLKLFAEMLLFIINDGGGIYIFLIHKFIKKLKCIIY